jgi:hypothetical protein
MIPPITIHSYTFTVNQRTKLGDGEFHWSHSLDLELDRDDILPLIEKLVRILQYSHHYSTPITINFMGNLKYDLEI